jgi:hypothetical protein
VNANSGASEIDFSELRNMVSGLGNVKSGVGITDSGVENGVSEVGFTDSGVGNGVSEGGFADSEGDFGVSGQEIADSGQKFVVSESAGRHKRPQIKQRRGRAVLRLHCH